MLCAARCRSGDIFIILLYTFLLPPSRFVEFCQPQKRHLKRDLLEKFLLHPSSPLSGVSFVIVNFCVIPIAAYVKCCGIQWNRILYSWLNLRMKLGLFRMQMERENNFDMAERAHSRSPHLIALY